jgi:hypothetical protein
VYGRAVSHSRAYGVESSSPAMTAYPRFGQPCVGAGGIWVHDLILSIQESRAPNDHLPLSENPCLEPQLSSGRSAVEPDGPRACEYYMYEAKKRMGLVHSRMDSKFCCTVRRQGLDNCQASRCGNHAPLR